MANPTTWADVVLLLHGEGTNGSTALLDSSALGLNLTAGAGSSISTAHAKFGSSCIALGGGRITNSAASVSNLGSSFTLEGFVWWSSLSDSWVFGFAGTQGLFYDNTQHKFQIVGTTQPLSSAVTPSTGAFHHIALVNDAGTTSLYFDGTRIFNAAVTYGGANNFYSVGSDPSGGGQAITGFVDEVRWVKNEALYSGASLTIPTAAFPESHSATGTSGTAFGAASNKLVQSATGVSPSTAFGTPTLLLAQTAAGTSGTAFGSASNSLTQTATGIAATAAFGSASNLLTQAANGTSSTDFGAPVAAYALAETATGFSTTAFGSALMIGINAAQGDNPSTAFGTPQNIPNAVGLSSTLFGTPTVIFNEVSQNPSTAFGLPITFNKFKAFGARTTTFGLPWTATNRTQVASGFSSTAFGTPIPIVMELLPVSPDAEGFQDTAFGLPTVHATIACAATGIDTTAFGTAVADPAFNADATGLAPTDAFGLATVLMTQPAASVTGTTFGAASHARAQQATPIAPTTVFGLPSQFGPHRATGRSSTWFGQPRALNQFRYPASGFGNATQFGSAAAVETHRVSPIYINTRWGLPTVHRTPSC